MARRARKLRHPPCYLCVQDEIYGRNARHPRATVGVGICREPYFLTACDVHLAQLQQALPHGGVRVVERYAPDGDDSDATDRARRESTNMTAHLEPGDSATQ